MSTYTGPITSNSTITNGGTITITGGSGGSAGLSSGSGGSVTIMGGTGGSAYITGGTGGIYHNYATPTYNDGYMYRPYPPKPVDIVDDLKTSLLGELDKYCTAFDEGTSVQGLDELMAKAEYNMTLLNMAAELIKERVDKLKAKTNDFLTKDGLDNI